MDYPRLKSFVFAKAKENKELAINGLKVKYVMLF